jgi:hypothetical protein
VLPLVEPRISAMKIGREQWAVTRPRPFVGG